MHNRRFVLADGSIRQKWCQSCWHAARSLISVFRPSPFFFPVTLNSIFFCTLVFLFCLSFLTFFPFPCRVTREHRENLAKVAKQLGNKAKDSLRRVRSNAVTQVKKAKEAHSEDTIRLVEKQVGDEGFPEIKKKKSIAWGEEKIK